MYLIPFTLLLLSVNTAQAITYSNFAEAASYSKRSVSEAFNNLLARGNSCPSVWNDISTTLTGIYLADGQCTDAARAAIRMAFHDCFNGACDGSLILANECSNSENAGMSQACDGLGNIAKDKNVGYADLIQFAAAHAIKTCPGGPTVPVKVGRKDSSTANPTGILPSANADAPSLLKLFASKGFSATDLVALIGAHSAAKQFTTDPSKAGTPLDSTPGQWDTKFYSETQEGKAPFTLQADKNLANDAVAGLNFKAFAASQGVWAAAFVPAMAKLSMLGVQSDGLVDCTSALPGGSSKRDVRRSSVWERLRW